MLLHRYVIRETGVNVVAATIILTAIFLAYSLARFLTDAAGGLFEAHEVTRLTLYKSLIALEVLVPLALYLAIIVSAGRLNHSNELVAMRAGGLGLARINRAVIVLSVLVATLVGTVSLFARPWAYTAMYGLKDQAEASSELDRIKPRRFYLYGDDERSVYVENISEGGRTLDGVFIRSRKSDGLEIITAPRGSLEPYVSADRHRLDLHQAALFKHAADTADVLARFGVLRLSLPAQRRVDHEYRTKASATVALFGSPDPDDRAELQWRMSTPVTTLLLALAALQLVDHRPRQGRAARLPLAIAIYAVYYNLLGVARTWVEQQTVPVLWWAPALLATALLCWTLLKRRRT